MIEEDNSELKKFLDIFLATVDYEIRRNESLLTPDQWIQFKFHQELLKQGVLSRYKIQGIEQLKKSLAAFTCIFKMQADFEYCKYIKNKTGHDIDLYGNILERIHRIVEKKTIKNRQELEDVIAMIEISRKSSTNNMMLPTLKNLSRAYGDKRRKSKTNHSHFVNYIFELNSPSGLRYVEIYEMNSTFTHVSIILENKCCAAIYQVRGINSGLSVSWKDDDNLVIETKKIFITDFTCKHISVHGINIRIEFIEAGPA